MSAVQTETTTLIAAGTWAVDPVHSSIRWDVIDLDAGMKSVSGRFTEFEGTVEGGEEQAASGTVRTASVLTDNDVRDGHLRSSDMLDTDRFPEIRFDSSRIEHRPGCADPRAVYVVLRVRPCVPPGDEVIRAVEGDPRGDLVSDRGRDRDPPRVEDAPCPAHPRPEHVY